MESAESIAASVPRTAIDVALAPLLHLLITLAIGRLCFHMIWLIFSNASLNKDNFL
jgi:hypothetical protein